MKVSTVFGLIIFYLSLIISLVNIVNLMGGYEFSGLGKAFGIIVFSLTICLGYLLRKTLLIPFQAFRRDMNQKQKLILAIIIPIIVFFIGLLIFLIVEVFTKFIYVD